MDDHNSDEFLWGYAVSQEQFGGNSTRDPATLVRCVKSGLLNSSYQQAARASLWPVVTTLLDNDLIRKHGLPPKASRSGKSGKKIMRQPSQQLDPRDAQDILTDFLTPVLRHTHEHLRNCHGFSPECKLRVIMTVPVVGTWSPQSSRILQTSIEDAFLANNMAGEENENLKGVFIIHEPEAAANYIMAATDCALSVSLQTLHRNLMITNECRLATQLWWWMQAEERLM